MNRLLLTLDSSTAIQQQGFDEVFLWSRGRPLTFTGSLDPHLMEMGEIGHLNVDFVRIALGVYAADRSVRRKGHGSDWNARSICLAVEVNDPHVWERNGGHLAETVGFLTGDRWTFEFHQAARNPAARTELDLDSTSPQATVLLSGGADSAIGALNVALDLPKGAVLQLVSHFSAHSIAPIQRHLVRQIREIVPHVSVIHRQVHLGRTSKRLNGSKFRSEPSSRSRSLLFIALGLAAGVKGRNALRVPENGFASLNPPLGPERRGSLSTRTTHPRYLADLASLLGEVGAHGVIVNPYRGVTKGAMFRGLADRVGDALASKYLSSTNSCAHTDGRFSGVAPGFSCGVCFGCIVRRSSFNAASLLDSTEYLCNDPSGRYSRFVEQKSAVEAMYDFAVRVPSPRMVMSMPLPPDYPAKDALRLCRSGVSELRGFLA